MRSRSHEQFGRPGGHVADVVRNAWFLEPAALEVPGSAKVEWLADAFVDSPLDDGRRRRAGDE